MLNKSRCHPESRRIIRTATKKCRKKSTLAGSLRYETTGVADMLAQASALPDYIYLLYVSRETILTTCIMVMHVVF